MTDEQLDEVKYTMSVSKNWLNLRASGFNFPESI